ncbi:YceI family protein [Amycolatopsis sp. OK19-0408]|uniref:YceI family protein n=1 Tax=Amycolatopsis iheyensis TaxID=2945988 RepID=A0A9X2NEV2_9PSEU|nr:YceI family protein [Amycolatopsis iheyensis]MCR6486388.1 YceI family protein [Amycolatopsis iheyensis]
MIEIPPPGEYRLDPARCRIGVSGTHLFGVSTVDGTFPVAGGRIVVADPVTASVVTAEVDATGLTTGERLRDTELQSRRFLHGREHPLITFTDGHPVPDGPRWLLDGVVTVRGTAGRVRCAIDAVTLSADGFTARAATVVDRFAFGLTYGKRLGGREFTLTLDVTAVRR